MSSAILDSAFRNFPIFLVYIEKRLKALYFKGTEKGVLFKKRKAHLFHMQ